MAATAASSPTNSPPSRRFPAAPARAAVIAVVTFGLLLAGVAGIPAAFAAQTPTPSTTAAPNIVGGHEVTLPHAGIGSLQIDRGPA
jgi:hypothetical protein